MSFHSQAWGMRAMPTMKEAFDRMWSWRDTSSLQEGRTISSVDKKSMILWTLSVTAALGSTGLPFIATVLILDKEIVGSYKP